MFHFQQFSVYQEKAAMKVGTDGVLLGAWTPVSQNELNILDIGTGTGLVALMLAQRCSRSHIQAIEIDSPSCDDALHNFKASPWRNRLSLKNIDFQSFVVNTNTKFDLIVCNPPFFSKSVKNVCERKARARHNHNLDYDELLDGSSKLLKKEGHLSVILPVDDFDNFRIKAARKGWFEHRRLMVKPNPEKPPKRVVSLLGKVLPESLIEEEMVLEMARHKYSEKFRILTGDFYLK